MKKIKKRIKDICKSNKLDFILLQFVDLNCRLKSIEISVNKLNDVLSDKIMFDASSIDGFSNVHTSDMFLRPDLNSYRIIEIGKFKVIRFMCYIMKMHNSKLIHFEGDPRYILNKTLNQMKRCGFKRFNVGFEPEFFLFKKDKLILSDCDKYFENNNYETLKLRQEVAKEIIKIGLSYEMDHHENAPGQYEINFKYDHAMNSCDNLLLFKYVLNKIALKYGYIATFMPKPLKNVNGSGLHMNVSLYDYKMVNTFFDKDKDNNISNLCINFISGVLIHAKSLCLITNPTVNSYKRLVKKYEAPVDISFSYSDRQTMIRVPYSNTNPRIEIRNPDAMCNPYLACSAILLAGLDGIKNKYCCLPNKKYGLLPKNLGESIWLFNDDVIINKIFSKDIKNYFISIKEHEFEDYNLEISNYELKKYFK